MINKPTPAEIKQTRLDAGLTQKKAAALVHRNIRSWQKVEAGDTILDLAAWELFLIKTKRSVDIPN